MQIAIAAQNDTPSIWLFQILGCLISWEQTMAYLPRQQIRFVEQYASIGLWVASRSVK